MLSLHLYYESTHILATAMLLRPVLGVLCPGCPAVDPSPGGAVGFNGARSWWLQGSQPLLSAIFLQRGAVGEDWCRGFVDDGHGGDVFPTWGAVVAERRATSVLPLVPCWCAPWFCRWRPWMRSSLRCEVSRGSGGGCFYLSAVWPSRRILVGVLWLVRHGWSSCVL